MFIVDFITYLFALFFVLTGITNIMEDRFDVPVENWMYRGYNGEAVLLSCIILAALLTYIRHAA